MGSFLPSANVHKMLVELAPRRGLKASPSLGPILRNWAYHGGYGGMVVDRGLPQRVPGSVAVEGFLQLVPDRVGDLPRGHRVGVDRAPPRSGVRGLLS